MIKLKDIGNFEVLPEIAMHIVEGNIRTQQIYNIKSLGHYAHLRAVGCVEAAGGAGSSTQCERQPRIPDGSLLCPAR